MRYQLEHDRSRGKLELWVETWVMQRGLRIGNVGIRQKRHEKAFEMGKGNVND